MEIAIFIFMSLPRYLLIYLFILAFCYSPVLKGQEESKDINYLFDLQLEELFNVEVNGASRILKRSASDVPAKILTITRQQISDRGYTSIIEVFEDLPDFKVDRLADPRSLHDVSIRGLRYMDKFIILIE
jgi:outer membrane receptor for ferrienterochelin and colicin